MAKDEKIEPNEFDYLKYGKSGLSVKDLDIIKDTALGISTSNYFKIAIGFFKIIVIAAWWYMRRQIIKQEILIERNKLHQSQINDSRDEVDVELPNV